MDEKRFDGLAKVFAAGGTRRAALRLLATSAVGAVVGRQGSGEAWASSHNDRRCRSGENACRETRALLCGGTLRRPCLCFKGTDKTICGDAASDCVRCRSDKDCAEKTGRGSVCIKVEGECGCQRGFTGRKTCVAPCPR